MDDLNETTGTAPAATPAPEPVADATPAPDVAAAEPVETTETTVSEPPAEPVADAAPAEVVIPEPIAAQLAEYEAEQAAWGPQWAIRDLAREATKTFVMGDSEAGLQALSKVSPRKTFELVHSILEANAAKHVADQHGISPDELANRLGTPPEIPMSRAIERAIDAMPDDEAAEEVRTVYEQNAELRRQLADAQNLVKTTRSQNAVSHEQSAIGQFVSDFSTWQTQALQELVEEVPAVAVNSVLTVTREAFRSDPASIKAVEAYSEAILRGENERVVKSHFLPPVLEALRAVMTAELVDVRGFKPKTPTAAGKNGTKSGPKVLGVTPGKGAAPAATAQTPAPEAPRGVEPRHQVAMQIAADIEKARAARRTGA